jgi:arylsulfatase A-like enzyme
MRSLLLSLLAFSLSTTGLSAAANVIVFLADDAGWGDYSFSGNTQIATPNIDSIAQGGVSLDRFYVCPVCSPTRAEFLTGRYHPRGGVKGVSTGQERLNLDEKTLADAFKAAGYATAAFGKWHNGSQWPYHPMARGFDQYFGHSSGHWGEYFDAPLEENGKMIRTKGYIVDVCTDHALQFIDKNHDRPFFCYIPFTTPHSPWAAPKENWDRFKNLAITQTATVPEQEQADETRCALAMVENQDWNVGRVLAKLRELKLEDDTLIIYFSDNGPNSARWTGGMKGKKGQTDEGGVRSVCYLKWPAKLPKGHQVTQIAGAIDLLPTVTALTGVARIGDKPLDGRDLSPLLTQQSIDWPERLIFSTWGPNISARSQTHRLDNLGNLYDMIADPGQTIPVNDQQPEIANRLAVAVADWRKEMFGTSNTAAPSAKSKAKGPAAKANAKKPANQVDPRPISVGYPEFPITILPARDGEPRGNVQRSSAAPNCSYFVNWTQPEDSIVWKVEVQTTGSYEVTIDYSCREIDAGATIELSLNDAKLSGIVTPFWDPPLYTNQDTLPRPHGESTMKEFKTLFLGTIELQKGQGPLTLRATKIPGQGVMDLRRLTLTLKK